MVEKILLIVNPAAGKGQGKNLLSKVLPVLCAGGNPVTTLITEKHGDAEEFAASFGPQFDKVVCIGGDGTFSETIGGIMRLETRPVVGYIPAGTTNDMATTLGLPKNPVDGAKNVLMSQPSLLDVGKLGEKYFSYISAFGAFTEISYSTPQERKNVLGHFAYILDGMLSIPSITGHHAVVTCDEGIYDGDFIFGSISNSTSVAGLVKLDPADVSLADGLFEVLLIKTPSSLLELNEIVTGILSHNYDQESVVLIHTKKIHFKFDEEIAWTRDGESGGKFLEVAAENCHNALSVLI